MKALLLLLTATICFAQDEPKKPDAAKYFRVDFVVKESEGGRIVNSRNSGMTVALGKGVIRTGTKSRSRRTLRRERSPTSMSA